MSRSRSAPSRYFRALLPAILLPVVLGLAAVLLSTCGLFAPRPAPPTPTVVPSPTPAPPSQVSPTVMPSPIPEATPVPTPTVLSSPSPLASPRPAPTPTAVPSPTPTPTPDGPEAALIGNWEGVLEVLRSEVPISASLQLVDGELWGTMDISTRRIEDLAFKAELQADGGIRFVIPQEDGDLTFDGKLEDGVITGGFRIGLIGGTFTLERAAPAATPTASTSE